MSTLLGDLIVRLGLDEASGNLPGQLKEIESGFNALDSTLTGLTGLIAIPTTLAAVSAGLVDMINTLQDAQNAITSSTGRIGADLAAFNQQILGVMSSSFYAADQIGVAMGKLSASLHLPAGDQLNLLTQDLLDLAKVAGTNVGPLADSVGKLLKAWKVDGDAAVGSIQLLRDVSTTYAISLTSLTTLMQEFGPVLRNMGLSFEQGAAFIGKLNDQGINVGQTIQGLQFALRTLSKQGLQDPIEGIEALITVIKGAKTEGDALAEGSKLLGRNVQNLVEAIYSGKLNVEDLTKGFTGLTSSIHDQAKQMETLAEAWQHLKNQTTVALSDAGGLSAFNSILVWTVHESEALVNAFATMGQYLGQIVDKFSALVALMGAAKILMPASKSAEASAGDITYSSFDSAVHGFFTPEAATKMTLPAVSSARDSIADEAFKASIAAAEANLKAFAEQEASKLLAAGQKNVPYGKYDAPTTKAVAAALAAGQKKVKTPYQQLQEKLKLLQQEMDLKKGIAEITEKISLLEGEKANPNQGYDLASQLAVQLTALKFYQANFQAQTADFYNKISDTRLKAELFGLDTNTSQKILGLPDPHDLDNQIKAIEAAFKKLEDSGAYTAAYLDNAFAVATTKIIADMRKAGESIPAGFITTNQAAVANARVSGMDFGLAQSDLGLTTQSQAANGLRVSMAALNSVIKAFNEGEATSVDVTNATISELLKEASAARATGQAFDDVKAARLQALQDAQTLASINTLDAYHMLGVPNIEEQKSVNDNYTKALDLVTKDIQASIDAATAAYGVGSQQELAAVQDGNAKIAKAQLDALNARIAQYAKAGQAISDADATMQQKLVENVRQNQQTMTSILSGFGEITAAIANQTIKDLQDNLARVGSQFGTSSNQYIIALASETAQEIALLIKAAKAIPDALNDAATYAAAAAKNISLSLNQAFANLGLQSEAALKSQETTMRASLDKILADVNASLFQQQEAQVAYNTWYYQEQLKLGNNISELGAAQNEIAAKQIALRLSDATNMYKVFSATVASLYNTISSDISTGLYGIITGTTSVTDAFKKMGEDVVKILLDTIVKNVIFTQSNLLALQGTLLHLFGSGGGGAAGAAQSAAGAAASAALPGAGGFSSGAIADYTGQAVDAGTTGTSAASSAASGGGVVAQATSSLLSMATAIGSIGGAIAGLIGDIQNLHIANLLGEIEVSTRRIDIGINATTGVGQNTLNIVAILSDIRAYMNTTLNTWLGDIDQNIQALHGYGTTSQPLDISPITRGLLSILQVLDNLYNFFEQSIGVHGSGTSTASEAFTRAGLNPSAVASAVTDAAAAATTATAIATDTLTEIRRAASAMQSNAYSDSGANRIVRMGDIATVAATAAAAAVKEALVVVGPTSGPSNPFGGSWAAAAQAAANSGASADQATRLQAAIAGYTPPTGTLDSGATAAIAQLTAVLTGKSADGRSIVTGDAQGIQALTAAATAASSVAAQIAQLQQTVTQTPYANNTANNAQIATLQGQLKTLEDEITAAAGFLSPTEVEGLGQTVVSQIMKLLGNVFGHDVSAGYNPAAQEAAAVAAGFVNGFKVGADYNPQAGTGYGGGVSQNAAVGPAAVAQSAGNFIGLGNVNPNDYNAGGFTAGSQSAIAYAAQAARNATVAANAASSLGPGSVQQTPYYGPTLQANGQWGFPSTQGLQGNTVTPVNVPLDVHPDRTPTIIQIPINGTVIGANPRELQALLAPIINEGLVRMWQQAGLK